MPGVGNQRKGTGDDSTDRFGDHEAAGEDRSYQQGAPVGSAVGTWTMAVIVVVTSVCMVLGYGCGTAHIPILRKGVTIYYSS